MLEFTFKAVSMIFAISAVATGAHSLVDPVSFAKSFGIPVAPKSRKAKEGGEVQAKAAPTPPDNHEASAQTYVSLMGVRQLATGLTLLTFAYQNKWNEVATILCILGFVVAGTDGVYISRSGAPKQGCWHAIPGALIAILSGAFIYPDAW